MLWRKCSAGMSDMLQTCMRDPLMPMVAAIPSLLPKFKRGKYMFHVPVK